MKTKEKKWVFLSFILLCGLTIFLALNRNSKAKPFTYQSEIWSDKAGYYIYLPAVFEYGFKAEDYPDSIIEKTGLGFSFEHGYIKTKYTYGVAFLQLPFYLASSVFHNKDELPGFTLRNHKMINVAGGFYLAVGLLFLYLFLRNYYHVKIAVLAIFTVFLGTNLYYFSTDESGMAHVYSFFLFSALLFLLKKTQFLRVGTVFQAILAGVVIGLIIVIRPTSAVFIIFAFLLDVKNSSELKQRIIQVFSSGLFWVAVLFTVLMFVPQFLYWYLISGDLLYYSYDEEGFNWMAPQILNTLFSPLNGLILYTPMFIFVLLGLVLMLKKKQNNGFLLFVLFALITYIFSSWWDWAFGCSLGARSYVEYYAIFSIAIAYFYQWMFNKNSLVISLFSITVILFAVYNLKFTYHPDFSGCFSGHRNWDWNAYFDLLNNLF